MIEIFCQRYGLKIVSSGFYIYLHSLRTVDFHRGLIFDGINTKKIIKYFFDFVCMFVCGEKLVPESGLFVAVSPCLCCLLEGGGTLWNLGLEKQLRDEQQNLKSHPSRSLEDNSTESSAYRDQTQEVTEGNHVSTWAIGHSCDTLGKNLSFFFFCHCLRTCSGLN